MNGRRGRDSFLISAIVLASALIGLAGTEGLLRLLRPKGLFSPAESLKQASVRRVDGVDLWDAPDMLRYSSADLDAAAADAASFKIVGLGDSIMFGAGLEREQTYLELLGKSLQRDLRRPVRVVDLAVPTYNTLQESVLFRERGVRLKPDIVLLHVWEDDVQEYQFLVMHGRIYQFDPVSTPPFSQFIPLPARAKEWMIVHSRAYQLLSRGLYALAGRVSAIRNESHWPQALSAIGDDAHRAGARVILLLSPRLDQGVIRPPAAVGGDDFYAMVRRWAGALGMEVVDLREALSGVSGPDIGLDGCHFNARGHRLVADLLLPRLKKDAALRNSSPR